MKISYSEVRGCCNELKKLKNNMESKIGAIKKINFDSFWEGESQEYYSKKLKKFLDEYDKLLLDIENSVQYILSVVDNYEIKDIEINNKVNSSKTTSSLFKDKE